MQKNILKVFQSVTDGDMSQTITSAVSNIQFLDNIGIQLSFTGSNPDGTFIVQVSTDQVIWDDLVFDDQPLASGSQGSIYIDLNQLSAPYIQVVFTPNGGSEGILNCKITGKEV